MAASAHILLRPPPACRSQRPRLLCLRSFFIPHKALQVFWLGRREHDTRKQKEKSQDLVKKKKKKKV